MNIRLSLLALALSAVSITVPGTFVGAEGCGVTSTARVLEPGGPVVSLGQTEVDIRDCVGPMALALSAASPTVPGTYVGIEGCGVKTQDVHVLEPGGPVVSVGQTEVDTRDCVGKINTLSS